MDLWLAAERIGDNHAYTREGRRARMIATILEPLQDTVAEDELRRLEAALCLVTGGEAIAGPARCLPPRLRRSLAVTHWAADAILTTGLRQQYESADNRSSRAKAQHPA